MQSLSEREAEVLLAVRRLMAGARHRRRIEIQITPTEIVVSIAKTEPQHTVKREPLY